MRLCSSVSICAAAGLLSVLGPLTPLPGLGASEATAQFWWGSPPPSYYRPRARGDRARQPRRDGTGAIRSSRAALAMPKPTAEEIQASKAQPGGPLIVTVSIASQRMTVYDASGPIIRGPVSTGKSGHPTPKGVFSIIQKNRHHRSNIYSGAPMPYMQRLTWSGIALHAGVLPGYPASAGCIRMTYPIAAKLFAMSRMGMRVVVASQEPVASAFSHPELPEPLMVAQLLDSKDQKAEGEPGNVVRVAATDGASQAAAQVATRFLNPMQLGAQERTRARTRVAEAHKTNKQLLEVALRTSAEANAAGTALRSAQAGLSTLQARAAAASGEGKEQLEAQVAGAGRRVDELAAVEAELSRAAYAAARASREAEEAVTDAEAAVKVAERGTEPIAVFISRREGKVFVRQGMVPLFEAPVTFADPGRPVGTHVYQVMSADTDTGRLGWKAITVPETLGFTDSLENRPPVRRGERVAPETLGPPSDARGALERVQMAPDVKRRIAERLWLNGSIVISDHGLGTETGKGTDFIVQTR